jgi:hypothetical protein
LSGFCVTSNVFCPEPSERERGLDARVPAADDNCLKIRHSRPHLPRQNVLKTRSSTSPVRRNVARNFPYALGRFPNMQCHEIEPRSRGLRFHSLRDSLVRLPQKARLSFACDANLRFHIARWSAPPG